MLTTTTKVGHLMYWEHSLETVDEDVVIFLMQFGLLKQALVDRLFVFTCLQRRFQYAENMLICGNANAIIPDALLLRQAVCQGGENAVDLMERSAPNIASKYIWWETMVTRIRAEAYNGRS